MPKIGNLAPSFSLKNQQGNVVQLKDFRNKRAVVLYFYPRALTPGCTVQACGLRDAMATLKKSQVAVLGISNDPVTKLAKFHQKESLNFDLLSDEDHLISEKYDVWGKKKFMGKEFMGLIRTTFVIGKDGRLKHIMNNVKTKTHADDLLALISTVMAD